MRKPHHWKQRKRLRAPDYDYRQPGAYFVTCCTAGKKCTLSGVIGTDVQLKSLGRLVVQAVEQIPRTRTGVVVDRFLVMPNHLHLIIRFESAQSCPLGKQIGQMKRAVTVQARKIGYTGQIFQDGFYDHIVRDQADLDRIREYIEANPARWRDATNRGNS